jgi:hypothetical protein
MTVKNSPLRATAVVIHVGVLVFIYGWLYWTTLGVVIGANIGQGLAGIALFFIGLPWSVVAVPLLDRLNNTALLLLLSTCALVNLAIHVTFHLRWRRRRVQPSSSPRM